MLFVDGQTEGNAINHPTIALKPVESFTNLYVFDFSVTKDYLTH